MTQKREAYQVKIVAESDDYDGTAYDGIAHRDYDGVLQVLIEDSVGWWDDNSIPYLLFYAGQRPSSTDALRIVQDARRSNGVLHASNPPSYFEMPDQPATEVALPNPCSFQQVAELGMRYGRYYRRVGYRFNETNSAVLVFYNDDADAPDQFDLDALLQLP